MAHTEKAVVISFRADPHLAELLNDLPDKSAFIRRAILSHFHQACPACKGRGVVPHSVARWMNDKLTAGRAITCRCCAYEFPEVLTKDADARSFLCEHCRTHRHDH